MAKEGVRFTQGYVAVADLLAVAVRPHHRPVPGPLADHQLPPDAGRQPGVREGRLPRPEGPVAAAGAEGGGYATAHVGKWHLGGGRDVTDAPKFAAYGYDLGPRHLRKPRAAPGHHRHGLDLVADDKVKRWDRTGVDGGSDARLPQDEPGQAVLREPLARRHAHAVGAVRRRPDDEQEGRCGRQGRHPAAAWRRCWSRWTGRSAGCSTGSGREVETADARALPRRQRPAADVRAERGRPACAAAS